MAIRELPPLPTLRDIAVAVNQAIRRVIGTDYIEDDAVTYAKIQNVTSDRLLGRDTAGSGDTEELTVGGGIEFTGSTGIQTSAFTGDVTKTAGGTALTIANDAVTYAKMQNVSATDKVLGRSTAGAGDVEEITFTSTARSLNDDASVQAMCATLGTWYVLAKSAVAASHTGDTNDTALVTVSIPAGAMGPNGQLRITTLWSYTNSANNKTLRTWLGGLSGDAFLSVTVTTTVATQTQTIIRNRNSASSQIGFTSATANTFGTTTGSLKTGTRDTATALDLVFSALLANAGETITLESYLVELSYGA